MDDQVLVITDQEVRQILSMKDAIDALDESFRELGAGYGVNRTRSHTHLSTKQEGTAFRFKTFEGGLSRSGFYGMRIFSDHLSYPTVGGTQRQVKQYIDDKYANGIAVVADINQNRMVALIADGWFSLLRVGGTSALGTKYLARPDAKEVGLLGTGWQARGLAAGLKIVLPSLQRIRVYSPNAANRERFASDMTAYLGISVEATTSADEAMADVDVISTATSAMVPVIDERWVKAGQHIVAGAHACEVPDSVIRRADVAVIAQYEVGIEPRSPEFEAAFSQGRAVLQGEVQKKRDIDWSQMGLLCDLAAGKIEGRKNREQITLIINNFGLGTQYAGLGALVYQLAKQRGVGKLLPYEWFLSEYSWTNPGPLE